MSEPQPIDLTPAGAAAHIGDELRSAAQALHAAHLDTTLDGYVRALGLALQLGPAPVEQVLRAVLQAAREMAGRQDVEGLSALGPALAGLVAQVRHAGALPPTAVMDAWATVAADLGALIGQAGLALSVHGDSRAEMLAQAHNRAALLDESTGSFLALTDWLETLPHPHPCQPSVGTERRSPSGRGEEDSPRRGCENEMRTAASRELPLDRSALLPYTGPVMDENARVDLHTHSFFSDGVLLPSEMLRRVQVLGYGALAITDHADSSNLEQVLAQLLHFFHEGAAGFQVAFIPGVELTHVTPGQIAPLARRARSLGARLVIVHGETVVEPVAPGTDRAAVECPDVDLLAHPGLISLEEAELAAANGVFLEVSARGGHCLTNGHVAQAARRTGARLVVNTDTHTPGDMIGPDRARQVALGAGLDEAEAYAALVTNAWDLVSRALGPRLQTI